MRRTALLIALAGSALAAVVAPVRAAVSLGLQDDAYLTSGDPRAWSLAGGLHLGVLRYNISWDHVAPRPPANPVDPSDPAYDFSKVDRIVKRATAMGTQVLITITNSPRWANGGRAQNFAPSNPASFGSFCRAVAIRYSGLYYPPGQFDPLPAVDRYTVWNEPNRGEYFMPQGVQGATAIRNEARLMSACVPAIQYENPLAAVALGPLASRGAEGGAAPVRFVDGYRAAGGPEPDVVAINPYLENLLPQYRPKEVQQGNAIDLRNLDLLESDLRAAYGRTVPMWLTEFAFRTAAQPGLGTITPARQAALLRQSVTLVRTHYPYAQIMVWFLLRDVSPTSYWRSGLVFSNNALKPSYGAWSALSQAAGAPISPLD